MDLSQLFLDVLVKNGPTVTLLGGGLWYFYDQHNKLKEELKETNEKLRETNEKLNDANKKLAFLEGKQSVEQQVDAKLSTFLGAINTKINNQ